MVRDKGKPPTEDEVDLVLEDKGQDKHEEVTKPRMVESYRPPGFFPSTTSKRQNLTPSLGNFWRCSKSCKSTSHSWMPSPTCPLMPNSSRRSFPTKGNFKNMPWFPLRRSVAQFFKTNFLQNLKISEVSPYHVPLEMSS